MGKTKQAAGSVPCLGQGVSNAGPPLFLESVKAKDGLYHNVPYHEKRMRRALASVNLALGSPLGGMLPKPPSEGLFKARVIYPLPDGGASVELVPYSIPAMDTLQAVDAPGLSYPHKYLDRAALTALKEGSPASEIIICVGGRVTDATIANLVLECPSGLYTPERPLLLGTKREGLLKGGIVKEADIRVSDLGDFERVFLVNAMLDLEDDVSVPMGRVLLPKGLRSQ
ncbi:MAG: aminotransferase class IV [Deltaproteobacteria bacterium]|jgi:4-amino-4-deoxychorismate lyase|nr:aminotransferase class IV [Deltaproteobacteria bacterium]